MTYYDDLAPGYDELHQAEQERKLATLLEHADIHPEDELLDVGCATASYWRLLRCRCTGIEPAAGLIAKSTYKAQIHQGRAELLPFDDARFDVVLCLSAAHLFTEPEQALDEMRRVGRRLWLITLLKRSKQHNNLLDGLKSRFSSISTFNDPHDTLCICHDKR